MSADNWTTCPKCVEQEKKRYDSEAKELSDSYGKISSDHFIEATKNFPIFEPGGSTFREYYEFYGADTGTLKMTYNGVCQVCGLSLILEKEYEFYPNNSTENGDL